MTGRTKIKTCEKCGAKIIRCKTEFGVSMAVDAMPLEHESPEGGDLMLTWVPPHGALVARYWQQGLFPLDEPVRYRNHDKTCASGRTGEGKDE